MQKPSHDSDRSPFRRPWITGLALLLGVLVLCTAAWAVSVVWTRTINGSADSSDVGRDVVLAPNGDVYVVGYIKTNSPYTDIWIRKYSSSGTKLWTRIVDGPNSGYDIADGAAVDASGNLYVVGYINTSTESNNIWIRKYNSSGTKLWTRTVNGPGNRSDRAWGVAVDSANNLYVVGNINIDGGAADIWIRKYRSSGAKLWTRIVEGPVSGGGGTAHAAAIDGNGNLYVVGYISVTDEYTNIWVRKYSSSGTKRWTRTVDGPGSVNDWARGATVDAEGNLYVVGHVSVGGEDNDIWIRKYNPSGTKLWTRTVDSQPFAIDEARDVTTDAKGAAYVIGLLDSSKVWIRKYSSTGVKRWTTTHTGPDGNATGYGIAINSTDRIYVTGGVSKAGQFFDIWVRKYRQ